jgi:predicted nucleotidyltransferase
MDNYVNVVLKRDYPYRFKDEASYQQFEQDVRTGVQKINLPDADIRFQGSALRNPNAKDIDIAIVVEPKTYRRLITQKFLGRAKENGKPINFENFSEKELVDLAKKIELDEIIASLNDL